MSLNEFEQINSVFQKSKHILVVFPSNDNGEAVGSALALKMFLEKQNKQIDIVSDNFVVPKNLKFLNKSDQILPALNHLQKFIIKVDVSKAEIDTISYDVRDNNLSIYLTPRSGTITKNDLRTAQSTYKYDLIITLNAHDKESLGDIFLNNTDLFFRTPIINIDNNPGNEHYGQINFVKLTVAGSNEIVYQILKNIDNQSISPDIATALLTSLIISTQSFKAQNVNPNTLSYASKLMDHGGKREEIIYQLYQTKSLSSLKIWGSALSKIKNYYDLKLITTSINKNDFAQTGAEEDDVWGLGEELITSTPEAESILIIHESTKENDVIKCIFITEKGDAREKLSPFNPIGNKRMVAIKINNQKIEEVEKMIIDRLKNI